MAETFDVHVVSYNTGDPGGDNKQLYLLRAPSVGTGGGITILGGEAVQAGTVTNSLGVGGTTFTLILHKYTNAATPVVYGTVSTNTLGGTAVTFKDAAPVGNQVLIGATLSATLQNLANFLNNSADVNISKASYTTSPTKLYVVYDVPGAGGNAFTLAASVAVPSGATLTGGGGTDISVIANLAGSPAYIANGIPAETALAAVTILDDQYSNSWYGLVIPSASDDDHLSVAAFIQSTITPHFYAYTSMDVEGLNQNSQTDIFYLMKEQGLDAYGQYSSTDAYAAVSALSRILTTDWTGSNTAITLKFKVEPGVTAESLSISQANALEAKNGNVFVNYTNGVAIIEQGICASGQFVDAIIGSDWFASFMQTSIFNLLYSTNTKIPQTDAGNHVIATTIQSVCAQAKQNGLVGPGIWNQPGFGELKQGDFLENGFYIYQPPIALQSQADRAARKSVKFQVAAIYAGAIHSASVSINVNQ